MVGIRHAIHRRKLRYELERAGVIQFFEIAIELAWKVLKDYLESHEIQFNSPREVIKSAFQNGFIENGHVWMDALADRNLTVQYV